MLSVCFWTRSFLTWSECFLASSDGHSTADAVDLLAQNHKGLYDNVEPNASSNFLRGNEALLFSQRKWRNISLNI